MSNPKYLKFLPLIIISIIGILLLRTSKLTVINEYFDKENEGYQNIQKQSKIAVDLSTDSLREILKVNKTSGLIYLGGGSNLNLPLKGDFEIDKGNNHTIILKHEKNSPRLWIPSTFLRPDTLFQANKKFNAIIVQYVDSLKIINDNKSQHISTNFESQFYSIFAAKKVSLSYSDFRNTSLKINAEKIDIYNCSLFQKFDGELNAKQIFLSSDSILNKQLTITCDTIKLESVDISHGNVVINANSIGKVFIVNSKLTKTNFNISWSKIYIKDVTLDSINTISLGDDATIESLKGIGKLSLIPKYYNNRNQNNRKFKKNNVDYDEEYFTKITLLNINPENLILPDQGFNFIVGEKQSYSKQVLLYKYLLERYKDNPEQFRKYDVAYQNFIDKRNNSWFSNFVRKNWNYFGYEKNMIFQNSIMLMLFFFSFNLLFFPRILKQGYYIKEFIVADRLIRSNFRNPWLYEIRNMINCFFYTFFVFWGLKLDIENLKVSNIYFCSLILLEYIVGIICLGYIANIIISK